MPHKRPRECDAIVVSDLHLGKKGKARPKMVRWFFDALARGELWRPQQVVLNGDVFENLDFRHWPLSHWNALAAVRRLERVVPVVWVTGNHDGPFEAVAFLAGESLAEPVGYGLASGDKRFLVTHGKWEMSWGDDPRSSVSYREAVEKLRDQWPGYDRHGLREAVAVARGAVAYTRVDKWDGAICGHTHGPFCGELGGVPYANCGSWTKGNPATYVVAAAGRLSLHTYTPEK